jgi:MFS superfamily sulfate permease-like transporter
VAAVGSIGVGLLLSSLDLTLPESSPELTWATAGETVFATEHLPLFFTTVACGVTLFVSAKTKFMSDITKGATASSVYIPAFTALVAAFFWVVVAAAGQATPEGMRSLQEAGWLFTTSHQSPTLATALKTSHYAALFDFSKVQWSALGSAAGEIATVVIIGVLNLPIATAALAKDPDLPRLNVDREMFGSAAGNLLAGAAGSVPNLIVSRS